MIELLAVLGLVLIGIVIIRLIQRAPIEDDVICAEDGCALYATHERHEDVTPDGVPIMLLVCHRHAGENGSLRS